MTAFYLPWVGVLILELIFASVTILGSAKFAAWQEWSRIKGEQ